MVCLVLKGGFGLSRADLRYFYVNSKYDYALETHLNLMLREGGSSSAHLGFLPQNVLGLTSESEVFAFTLRFGNTVREIFDHLFDLLEVRTDNKCLIFEFSLKHEDGNGGFRAAYGLEGFVSYLIGKGQRGLLNPIGSFRPLVDLGYLTVGAIRDS